MCGRHRQHLGDTKAERPLDPHRPGWFTVSKHLEIERRFFVNQHGERPWRTGGPGTSITQYYLDGDLIRLERGGIVYNGTTKIVELEQEMVHMYSGQTSWTARIRFRDAQTKFTLKWKMTGATAIELEWPIERGLGEQIVTQRDHPYVEKRRYEWTGPDGFVWEVDEFEGGLDNLIVAEVELPSEDTPVVLPDWVGVELTGNRGWSNASLARRKTELTRDKMN